jgi:hypothetical protein
MEVLIKHNHNDTNLSFICLIYGGDNQKDYYWKNYCEHNKIITAPNPLNQEPGLYSIMIDINNYLVYERTPDNIIKNLYYLIYIQRNTKSPFHKDHE